MGSSTATAGDLVLGVLDSQAVEIARQHGMKGNVLRVILQAWKEAVPYRLNLALAILRSSTGTVRTKALSVKKR